MSCEHSALLGVELGPLRLGFVALTTGPQRSDNSGHPKKLQTYISKQYFAPCYRHPLASTWHTPSSPKDKITHSVSAPIAFLPRIHNIIVDKFFLVGNGRISPNGSLLCCPHLTILGNRTRTSVVAQPLCCRQLLHPPNALGRTRAVPEKTLLHAISTHPPADNTPSPAHTSYSLINRSTSPIIGC